MYQSRTSESINICHKSQCMPIKKHSVNSSTTQDDIGNNDTQKTLLKKNIKVNGRFNTGRWSAEEHKLFLEGLDKFPHGSSTRWRKVACFIGTRTIIQTRTHAQKYFHKLEKQRKNITVCRQQLIARPILPLSLQSNINNMNHQHQNNVSYRKMPLQQRTSFSGFEPQMNYSLKGMTTQIGSHWQQHAPKLNHERNRLAVQHQLPEANDKLLTGQEILQQLDNYIEKFNQENGHHLLTES